MTAYSKQSRLQLTAKQQQSNNKQQSCLWLFQRSREITLRMPAARKAKVNEPSSTVPMKLPPAPHSHWGVCANMRTQVVQLVAVTVSNICCLLAANCGKYRRSVHHSCTRCHGVSLVTFASTEHCNQCHDGYDGMLWSAVNNQQQQSTTNNQQQQSTTNNQQQQSTTNTEQQSTTNIEQQQSTSNKQQQQSM